MTNKSHPTGDPIYSEYRFVIDDTSVTPHTGRIELKEDLSSTDGFIPITAPEVKLTSVNFQVIGARPTPGDVQQPRIVMTVQGYAGVNLRSQSYFNLQTTITQRTLDF